MKELPGTSIQHCSQIDGLQPFSRVFRSVCEARRLVNLILAASSVLCLGGCAQLFYQRTPTGTFSGKLYIEWIAPNQFVYRPDPSKPLTYVASDGLIIIPKVMTTDGGSIPRLFWSASGLGPWDFAPGYIVHDWLFEQHHCKFDGWERLDFERSASLLAEAMKTQMERAKSREPAIVYAVYEAVKSPIAKALWDQRSCRPPPAAAPQPAPAGTAQEPIQILVIDTEK